MKAHEFNVTLELPHFKHPIYIDDLLFYFGFALWLGVILVNRYTFFVVFVNLEIANVIQFFCIFLFAVCEALSILRGLRWTRKTVIALIICAIMSICSHRAGIVAMTLMTPVLFFARNRDISAILKISATIYIALIVVTALCAQLGIIQNITTNFNRERHLIGFRYPLYPATLFFLATCLITATHSQKADGNLTLLLLLGSTLLYSLTASRLSFILALCMIAISCIAKSMEKHHFLKKSVIAAVLSSCFVMCAILSIGLAIAYDPNVPWMAELNKAFGSRLALCHNGITNYGITAFGQQVEIVSNALDSSGKKAAGTYNFLDSIYIQFIVRFGVAYLIVYVLGMTAATYRAFRSGNATLGFSLILIAIHGIIDNQTMYLWMNPLMFYAISILSEKTNPNSRLKIGMLHGGTHG